MAIEINVKDGKAKVEIGKEKREIKFSYKVIGDHPKLDEIINHLVANEGYLKELPAEVDEEETDEESDEPKQRGKARTPRSIAGALIKFFANDNQATARQKAVQEATDTAEAKAAEAYKDLLDILFRSDITEKIASKVIAGLKAMDASEALELVTKKTEAKDFVKALALAALSEMTTTA